MGSPIAVYILNVKTPYNRDHVGDDSAPDLVPGPLGRERESRRKIVEPEQGKDNS